MNSFTEDDGTFCTRPAYVRMDDGQRGRRGVNSEEKKLGKGRGDGDVVLIPSIPPVLKPNCKRLRLNLLV